MVDEDCAEVDSPFTFVFEVAIQLKLEGTVAVNAKFTSVLSQMVSAVALVMTGVGRTVTVMVWVVPTQFPEVEVGVTWKITVWLTVVVLVKVRLIGSEVWLPLGMPITLLLAVADQL